MNNTKSLAKATVDGVSSLIPIISSISTFVNSFLACQWNERREKVEHEFEEKFKINEKKFDEIQSKIDKNNSNFAFFLNATKNAMGDCSEEKIKNYVNAAYNAIMNETFSSAKIHIFLNQLQKYSVLHLKILLFFSKNIQPTSSGLQTLNRMSMPSTEDSVLEKLGKDFTEISKDRNLLRIVLLELNSDGMISFSKIEELHNTFSGAIIPKKTTALGDEFLGFVS